MARDPWGAFDEELVVLLRKYNKDLMHTEYDLPDFHPIKLRAEKLGKEYATLCFRDEESTRWYDSYRGFRKAYIMAYVQFLKETS